MSFRTLLSLFLISLLPFFAACGDDPTNQTQKEDVVEEGDPSELFAAEKGIQAGVVISFSEESVLTLARTLDDEETPLDALLGTGETIELADFNFGMAICGIGDIGQPADDCFGDSKGRFWAFFVKSLGGEWESPMVGADQLGIEDGDSFAFVWTGTDADFNPLRTPPDLNLGDLDRL